MTDRRFPAPWTVDQIPGCLVVRDAIGQSLAYVYRATRYADAHNAKVLTEDEARRIASNIAKLPQPSALALTPDNAKSTNDG